MLTRWKPGQQGPHSAIPGIGSPPFAPRNPPGHVIEVASLVDVPDEWICIRDNATGQLHAVEPGTQALEQLKRRIGMKEREQVYPFRKGETQRAKEIAREASQDQTKGSD